MKIIGIICEYNPFHNGHLYQINKIKELYNDCLIIAIMSGNYVQRGDFSILNKYDKTKIALNYGIDLVVELPYYYSVQSADMFCYGALKIANMIGCNAICFGAEHDDINYFYRNINIIATPKYDSEVKKLLKSGLNYPTATSKALKNLGGDNIDLPNDILALRYINEIVTNNYEIEPIIIKRTNNYHDLDLNNSIISASNIRNKINNNIDIKKYVPNKTYELLNNKYIPRIEDYYNVFRYNVICNKDNLFEFIEVDKPLASRILKYIYVSNDMNEFVNNIKTKNYTTNKINRVILHILLNLRKNVNYELNSIKVLGFNSLGKKYMNSIKRNIKLINKFSDISDKDTEIFLNYLYYYHVYNKDVLNNCLKEKVIYFKDLKK